MDMVHYRRQLGQLPMISFAQNGEDVLIDRAFPEPSGYYIDVGACHPVRDSVTHYFYSRGWRGINIEPVTELWRSFQDIRPADINLNIALGARTERRTFYAVPTGQVSTLSAERLEYIRSLGDPPEERTIEVDTLAAVCARHAVPTIDVLKIDAEGWEAAVLAGGDWLRFRPRLVIAEATRPNSTASVWHDWEPALLANGYLFACFDGINRYFLRQEDSALLAQLGTPVNYLDVYVRYELVHKDLELKKMRGELEELRRRLAEISRQDPTP